MKNKKYIMCSGLAFADQEDMDMLHRYALDGWIFKEFRGLCYVLYKDEPQDLIFSYDIQKVKKAELDDYQRIFEEGGWHMIPCKDDSIHFFYAKAGTVPLHSNPTTRSEQFKIPFYASLAITIIGIILLIASINLTIPSVFAGIGGGCIGGGGILLIGSYLRLHHKRLRVHLTFMQAVKVTILGVLLMMAPILFPKEFLLIGKASRIIGICCVMFGVIYACANYRIYRDGKESRGK